jgi:hypothetical protein
VLLVSNVDPGGEGLFLGGALETDALRGTTNGVRLRIVISAPKQSGRSTERIDPAVTVAPEKGACFRLVGSGAMFRPAILNSIYENLR